MNTNVQVQTNNEETLAFINDLVGEWFAKFDNPPEFEFDFSVQDGALFYGGTSLCPAALIEKEESFCDVELIHLGLSTKDSVNIHILWPAIGNISTYIEMLPSNASEMSRE